MQLAPSNRHRSLRNRAHARGAIVRTERRRLCAESSTNCRLKRNHSHQSCTRLGTISKDPIGFEAGDANLYRYVGNTPTTLTDPSGLQPPSIGAPTGNEPEFTQEPWFYEYDRLRQLRLHYRNQGGDIPFSEGSRLAALESRVQQELFIHKAKCNGYSSGEIAMVLIFRPGGGFDQFMSTIGTTVRSTPITRAGGARPATTRPVPTTRPSAQPPASGTQRPLTPQDIGINPAAIELLAGSIGRRGNTVTVQVQNIKIPKNSRGKFGSPFDVLDQLAANARSCGATHLKIQGLSVGNAELAKVLTARYGFEYTPQRTLELTIPLQPQGQR